MSVHGTILQAAREWFKVANGGLTDAQVIKANPKGPRPPLPYLSIKVSGYDEAESFDETRTADDGAGGITWSVRGSRSGTIDVQGYAANGDDTPAEWIADAMLRRARPDVSTVIDTAGLTVIDEGQTIDIARALDTETEWRFLRTVSVRYAVTDSAVDTRPELGTTETVITLERYENHPDPLTATLDIDVP